MIEKVIAMQIPFEVDPPKKDEDSPLKTKDAIQSDTEATKPFHIAVSKIISHRYAA